MALANFFDKSALAASQILQGYDTEGFREKLLNTAVEVAFDSSAIQCKGGRASLDLSVRLLSRLYPTLVITALDLGAETYNATLTSIALAINPEVEISNGVEPIASIVVGATLSQRTSPKFYIGSDNWKVCFSTNHPVSCSDFGLAFAAGAAACFGVANVFRVVFGDQLQNSGLDNDFELSLIDFSQTSENTNGSIAVDGEVNIGESILVGLGAIGQGTLWALSNATGLTGSIGLIDDETVDLSNLQRYVLTDQSSVDAYKTSIATSHLSSTSLQPVPHEGDWASFVVDHADWKFPTVVVAVDSARDRIAIQSSLPHSVINAWTQPLELGISRHFDFLNNACLACMYPPRPNQQRESDIIAGSLGLLAHELQVRELIYNNAPVTRQWIEEISRAKEIPLDTLSPFCDLPIREFYSKVICGGVVLTGSSNQQTETPMAFQSALAGILLASELVIYKGGVRDFEIETTTRINLLRPLGAFLNDAVLKPASGNCICQDSDFRNQYSVKYPSIEQHSRIDVPITTTTTNSKEPLLYP